MKRFKDTVKCLKNIGRKLLLLLLRIGFGFIKDLQTQESVFIYASKFSEAINEKDKVTSEAEAELEGLSALNVKKNIEVFRP